MQSKRGCVAALAFVCGLSMAAEAHASPGDAPEAGTACALVRSTHTRPTGDVFYALAKKLQVKYGISEGQAANYIQAAVNSVYDHATFMCSEN